MALISVCCFALVAFSCPFAGGHPANRVAQSAGVHPKPRRKYRKGLPSFRRRKRCGSFLLVAKKGVATWDGARGEGGGGGGGSQGDVRLHIFSQVRVAHSDKFFFLLLDSDKLGACAVLHAPRQLLGRIIYCRTERGVVGSCGASYILGSCFAGTRRHTKTPFFYIQSNKS